MIFVPYIFHLKYASGRFNGDNKTVARQGAHVAGTARKEIEVQTEESIVSPDNANALRLANRKK